MVLEVHDGSAGWSWCWYVLLLVVMHFSFGGHSYFLHVWSSLFFGWRYTFLKCGSTDYLVLVTLTLFIPAV
jgi:hypothetical protein